MTAPRERWLYRYAPSDQEHHIQFIPIRRLSDAEWDDVAQALNIVQRLLVPPNRRISVSSFLVGI